MVRSESMGSVKRTMPETYAAQWWVDTHPTVQSASPFQSRSRRVRTSRETTASM